MLPAEASSNDSQIKSRVDVELKAQLYQIASRTVIANQLKRWPALSHDDLPDLARDGVLHFVEIAFYQVQSVDARLELL